MTTRAERWTTVRVSRELRAELARMRDAARARGERAASIQSVIAEGLAALARGPSAVARWSIHEPTGDRFCARCGCWEYSAAGHDVHSPECSHAPTRVDTQRVDTRRGRLRAVGGR